MSIAPILADPALLFGEFASLGENCELGFVQRHFGIEPVGLLRWASVGEEQLLRALDNDFDGLGDPQYTRYELWDGEYVIFDTRYGFHTHTWIRPQDVGRERVIETACRRLRFLVRKFREDAAGERILVRVVEQAVPAERIRALHRGLRRYGPAVLLHLTESRDAPPAAVGWLDGGLMVGGIRRLGRRPQHRWDIAFDDWLAIARDAFALHTTEGRLDTRPRGATRGDNPQSRLRALVAEIAADRRPAALLRRHLQALDAVADRDAADLGTALFESIFYRLPSFADAELPACASRLYERAGRSDAAFLLAGFAAQQRPRAAAPPATPLPAGVADRATVVLASPNPGAALLLSLEALEHLRDWQSSTQLFEAVWPRVPPLLEYWVFHRMSQVYDGLGRADAAVFMAALAIRMHPGAAVSEAPYRRLLRYFLEAGRPADAAELCERHDALSSEPSLLHAAEKKALLAEAGPLFLSPPPAGRHDRAVIAAAVRHPRPWPQSGGMPPGSMSSLFCDMHRPPIEVAQLDGATVLVDRGNVVVFGPDGIAHDDLATRDPPAMVQARLEERGAPPVEDLHIDQAMLLCDYHYTSNLCHFLLDHATRIEIYRRAKVDIRVTTAIGLDLTADFQRVVSARMGVRSFLPVLSRARVRVNRLFVSSNCHTLCHPAHWGADWAIAAVRGVFDLTRRGPARRLLVSRADSPYRRIGNHDEVAALLAPLGFEVIVPGELPFLDQVAAFRDATHVVAPHGAALANTLFCAPATQVLEAFHPQYGTWAYAMLNAPLALNYTSIVGRDALSDEALYNDPNLPREVIIKHAGRDMRVDMDELRRWLTDSGAW